MRNDPVEQMRELLDELVITFAISQKIERELIKLERITEDNADTWEDLFEKQFEIAVKLNGIHGDMIRIARRHTNDENKFQMRRYLQEADKVYKPLVLEL